MKLPHWLRHDWSAWEPPPKGDPQKRMIDAYDSRYYDLRHCRTCGRRQMRNV